jgi:hypothetical protein
MTQRAGFWPRFIRRAALALALACGLAAAPPQRPPTAKRLVLERDVRPLLAERCLKCHGGNKPRARLDLRSRSAILAGGESGPAVVPGSAEKSLLFQMVHKGDMPPGKEAKLTAGQVALLRTWIDQGAPAAEAVAGGPSAAGHLVTEKEREFWAFQPPVRPVVPAVKHAARVRTPVDAFLLEKLERKGLTFAPDADRGTLIRRLSLDLLGLPPSPAEVDAFVADVRPDAYERLVDRLLASPHYGERWGRHWLDAAGYADTIGGDNDPPQVFMRDGIWRYRDYVIRSLNADKPFDTFLREQLAGDEMDDWRAAATLTPQMKERLISTGFLRTTVDHTFEMELNRPFERYQVLHDTIEILTSNVLGLTVACARCHDHKFDPVRQVDYYRLLAVLKPAYNPEAWIQPQNHHLDDVSAAEKDRITRHNSDLDRQAADLGRRFADIRQPVEMRLFETKLIKLPEVLRADLRTALAAPAGKRSEVQKYLAAKLGPLVRVTSDEINKALSARDRATVDSLQEQIAALQARKRSVGKIQATWEPGQDRPPPTRLFRRGNLLTPGPEMQPGVLSVLTDARTSPLIGPPPKGARSSGRRTALARWLTRPDHPLTARVFVNRVWQHHFGRGIVATPDNFGRAGSPPTHRRLLDWLATEFVRGGWQTKELHRVIVTSTAYCQASVLSASGPSRERERAVAPPLALARGSDSRGDKVDPGNLLLWKMPLRRVEAEVLRDSVLAVAGTLDRTFGGPPVPIEPRPDGLVVVSDKGLPWPTAVSRRSVYLLTRRNYNLTLLGVFDQPVMATNCTRRITSAVPLQSLTLLNDATMLAQADAFAARVAAAADSADARIETAFRLAFARRPKPAEKAASAELLKKLTQTYAARKPASGRPDVLALAKLCHVLLCANEFLYVG